MFASRAWRKSCRAVSRSTIRMGAPQRGQGHETRGCAVTGDSTSGIGATASAWRHWKSPRVRQCAARKPKWRIRTKGLGSTWSVAIAVLAGQADALLSQNPKEFHQHLAVVLEQCRRHPKPRSAGIIRALAERGEERELFRSGR